MKPGRFGAPPVPRPALRLAEVDGLTILKFPVMRPFDLRSSHDVEITIEILTAMAAAYSPGVEIATLNTDHACWGPSLGNCTRLWMEGDLLWSEWTQIEPEFEKQIRAGQWPRRSAEFVLFHASTQNAYFTGCALLGARRPAVKNLPPVELGEESSPIITLYEETPMPDPVPPTPPPAPAAAPPDPPVTPPAPSESERALAARLADLERRELSLSAATRVREALTRLGTRVTPAFTKAGVPELLTSLALAAPAGEIKLADGGTTVPGLFELAERVLGTLPLNDALFTEQAKPADANQTPSEAEKKFYAQFGIDDKRRAELDAKYGAS